MITLILAHPTETHGQHIANALLQRGQKCLFFDTSSFPLRTALSLSGSGTGYLCLPDYPKIPFSDIRSVYWRNYNTVVTGYENVPPSFTVEYVANNDSRSMLESTLQAIDTLWVNGWDGYYKHQRKPSAFLEVAKLGVKTPKSLFSNDIAEIRNFLSQVECAIQKPIQGGQHTRRFDRSDLERLSPNERVFAPATFQEEIKGTNIRAFVCGEQVLACEILTHEIDFRDDKRPEFFIHELSDTMKLTCRQIAKTLGLIWTGIDFRLAHDGHYYYLEANPSPMFIGFETYAKLPLTEALCNLLMSNN